MGCESPVGEPAFIGIECGHLAPSEWVHPFNKPIERQLLADGKGDPARDRLKDRYLLLQYLHFRHPWRSSQSAKLRVDEQKSHMRLSPGTSLHKKTKSIGLGAK